MSAIERTASSTWQGDLRSGEGKLSGASGALPELPVSYATRFENTSGTSPEELIAAAHAACYNMALANHLAQQGSTAEQLQTDATVSLEPPRITRVRLVTRGRVPGLDSQGFAQLAAEAEKKCPVSNLLRPGVDAIELETSLE